MFINVNDILVNLKNVSNINILKRSNRIVFNMNYTIEIVKGNDQKYISDYVYWDCATDQELIDNIKTITESNYFKNFIVINNSFINKNEISTVKYDKYNTRIIFNLSHPVTFKNKYHEHCLTSEFVYVTGTSEQYDEILLNLS